jgi:hypothetical protein
MAPTSKAKNDANGHLPVEPKKQHEAAEKLSGLPFTLGYRPSHQQRLGDWEGGGRHVPWRMLFDVEKMLMHPDVLLPYEIYKSGISSVKFKIKADSTRSAEFAHDLLGKLWTDHLDQCQNSYDYGWAGLEACYKQRRGYMYFDSLIDIHPLDTWAMTAQGRYVGMRVAGVSNLSGDSTGGMYDLWGPGKWPAKGLWLSHRRRWDRYYGRTQLSGAWRPYRRLATPDGAEEVIDGAVYRCGYQGPLVRFPREEFLRDGTNQIDYEAARKFARQMAEQAKAGMSLGLPSDRDEQGNYLWDFIWPTSTLDVGPLLTYEENIQKQISRGVGTPPELFQAESSGSGWSGRKVPLLGFYNGQARNARELTKALVIQIVMPLLRWNFGHGAWVEVEVEVTLPGAISGEPPEQAGPEGAQPPGAEQQPGMEQPPQPGGGQPGPERTEGLEDLLNLVGAGAGGGTGQPGQLSLVEAEDDGWLDAGWYPDYDIAAWSVDVPTWEFASGEDAGRYIQKQITRGPRKGQTWWYDTHRKRFLGASWKPHDQRQRAAPAAPAPRRTATLELTPSQKRAGTRAAKKASLKQWAQGASQRWTESQATEKKAKTARNISRLARQTHKELAAEDHPVNRYGSLMERVDMGAGEVKTLRSNQHVQLSAGDHAAMERLHNRAAAVLSLNNQEDKAKAQRAAAMFHQSAGQRVGRETGLDPNWMPPDPVTGRTPSPPKQGKLPNETNLPDDWMPPDKTGATQRPPPATPPVEAPQIPAPQPPQPAPVREKPPAPVEAPKPAPAPPTAPAVPAGENPLVKQLSNPATLGREKHKVFMRFTMGIGGSSKVRGAAPMSHEDVLKRQKHVAFIFNRMPDAVVQTIHTGTTQIEHYGSGREMAAYLNKKYDFKGKERVGSNWAGAYLYGEGFKPQLHLDGKEGHTGNMGTAINADSHDSLRGTYAHEMTHALDGPDGKHSGTDEWKRAFSEEIKHPDDDGAYTLSKYASTDESEGFAEFGRLLYGTATEHEAIKQSMPKCFAYFQKAGLIDTPKPIQAPAPGTSASEQDMRAASARIEGGQAPQTPAAPAAPSASATPSQAPPPKPAAQSGGHAQRIRDLAYNSTMRISEEMHNAGTHEGRSAVHERIKREAEEHLDRMNLSAMSRPELKKLGRELSVDLRSARNKEELVDMIRRVVMEPIELTLTGGG